MSNSTNQLRRSWCTRCRGWKPLTDFSPTAKHPDGSYATVLSRCKPCLAELKRIRRREDPQWAKAVDRADWQRIKADPAKHEKRRALTRENAVAHRRRNGALPRAQRIEDRTLTRVSTAPFREAFERAGVATAELAARVGVDEAHLRRMLRGERAGRVSYEMAAKLCAALGLDPVDVGV